MTTKTNIDTLGQAFVHGFVDRAEYGLLEVEQMYRWTPAHRFAWRLGWKVANALTKRPLRTAKVTA